MNKTPRHHKLLYGSSYDRGLQYLLVMWKDIRKQFPDAQLHIAYGWSTFDKLAAGNPERMAWKDKMVELMKQPGIKEHGRISKDELDKLTTECGVLAYPTDFFEISCITVLNSQKLGCVPVVMNPKWNLDEDKIYCALNETVYSGLKVDGDIKTDGGRLVYLQALTQIMGNETAWKKLSEGGKKGIYKYKWENIALEWGSEFVKPISKPKVSIITPTIRKGFWNLMASNISMQSYRNIEWIVVDDYPKNREYYMRKSCEKWGIVNWKYVRGDRSEKYHYGLSTANNIGWKAATGELLVFLQDFVLMPTLGIEALVDIYRHNPNALIAPTDTYYFPNMKPNTDSEDWFDGKTDVVGEFSWENIRNKGIGIRFSDKAIEWEANYGAIPKHIVDDLGGWYEFYNDALGFDNTEIAYRALLNGYKIIVDDTNQAVCLDHWEALKDKPEELGEKRTLRLNDPRFEWMIRQIDKGNLPSKRKEEPVRLEYEIPENLGQKEAVDWMNEHLEEIINKWGDYKCQ